MDALTPTIEAARADDPRLSSLFERHLSLMRASSPACSVHAMEPDGLSAAGVRFFIIRDGDATLGMGALKPISETHVELKSMHVVDEARGRGLARRFLRHLIAEARREGATRISLETGVQKPFAAARSLYRSEGFEPCEPYEGYGPDPNSAFFTLRIS